MHSILNKNHLKALKKVKTKLSNIIKKRINIEEYSEILSEVKMLKLLKVKFKNLNILKTDIFHKIQKKFNLFLIKNDNQVFLKQSGYWASAITWTLMGGTVFAIGWLAIAETEEIVVVQGKLQPKSGVVDVQMPMSGVTKEVLVKEGERVKKGQILIILDTDITEEKNNALKTKLSINNLILSKLSSLVKEGAVSEYQYLQQKALVEEIKSEIKTNLVTLNYQKIKSPINGLVFDLQPKGVGYVANTSQPVLKIVPSDNLLAKIEIDSRKIGFVKTGKLADISIDSFPASDFGVLKGSVTKIGSDALLPSTTEGKGLRFPAEITLENQYLKLKSGKKLALQAGMSLTANIKLRKVTYLQLLLNNFTEKTKSLKSI